MPVGPPKATAVKIEGMQVKKFFREDFVKEIEGKFAGVKFEHFCLSITQKGEDCDIKLKDHFVVSHQSPEDEKNAMIEIETKSPDSCDELVKMLTRFYDSTIE